MRQMLSSLQGSRLSNLQGELLGVSFLINSCASFDLTVDTFINLINTNCQTIDKPIIDVTNNKITQFPDEWTSK